MEILLGRFGPLSKEYNANPDAVKKLLSAGESKRDESINPAEHAAYMALCTLLLNLDESLTKE